MSNRDFVMNVVSKLPENSPCLLWEGLPKWQDSVDNFVMRGCGKPSKALTA